MVDALFGGIRRGIGTAAWRLLKSSRRTEDIAGFEVALDRSETTIEALGSLTRGLELLEHGGGHFARRARRGCTRILVRERAFARYWRLPRAAVVGQSDLVQMSNGEVALLLLHEATHARLEGLGLTARRFGLDRIERVCLRRERALAQSFPDPARWISLVDQRLRDGLWDRHSVATRVEKEFAERGFPGWIARIVARIATRNHPARMR